MANVGSITFGVNLDTDKFDRQISKLERNIQKEENKNIDINAQIVGLQKQIDDFAKLQRQAEQARLEIEKLEQMPNLAKERGIQLRAGDYLPALQQARDNYARINAEIEKQSSGVADVNSKMEALKRKQELINMGIASYKRQIDSVRMHKHQAGIEAVKSRLDVLGKKAQSVGENVRSGLGKAFGDTGNKIQSSIKKIAKLALGVFALRSAYAAVRQASSTLATYDKQYGANLEYIRYALAQSIAPILQWIVNLAGTLLRYINSIVSALFGINLFGKASANNFQKMKTGASGAAKAAKEIKKQLAGFDEINMLSDQSDSGGGGGGGGSNIVAPSFNLADTFKSLDIDNIGKNIAEKINDALYSINWSKIQSGARRVSEGLANQLNDFIGVLDWSKLGDTIAQGINTAIYFVETFLSTFNFQQFGRALGDLFFNAIHNIDWLALANAISLRLMGILDAISAFFEQVDWGALARDLEKFILNIDYSGIANSFFRALGSAFGALGAFIGQIIKDAWGKIKEYFGEWINNAKAVGGDVIDGLLLGILNAISAIAIWIYDHIFKPFIDGFKKAFGIHSPSKVMEEQGKFLIEGLKQGLLNIWEAVKTIFENLKNNIVNVFKTMWSKIKSIFEPVVSFFSNKFTQAYNTIRNVFTPIQSFFNNLWNNIKNGAQNAWNRITGIFGGIASWFGGIINSVIGKFRDFGGRAGEAIGGAFKGAVNGVLRAIENILNSPIRAINSLISTINAVPGINLSHLRTFSLPRLASGGIVNMPNRRNNVRRCNCRRKW